MKIALECQDILIEKTLQLFLKEYLVMKKDCDFLVCDEKSTLNKPQFVINNNSPQLNIPFSKEELMSALNEFNTALEEFAQKIAQEKIKALEAKIEALADEFHKIYQHKLDSDLDELKQRMFKVLEEK
ncbi:ornithine carbamoyltransferase [Campylobacter sp. MIT 99-7217]|uniref:ornithine carbamoyltransferase n=1 Tax=Campylobacter sp. MIT 99-7217 TaxID=535091 RepID=UPI00115A6333|nr:ornithine carbamoyltransferase [Campylobacter sp. MIT 99-7217]TQR34733.1 ornithine carbamoyltransferase [Campylobacter sp. MIT 99-7217]